MVELLVTLAGLPFLLGGVVLLWYGGRLTVGLLRRHLQTTTVDAEVVDASVAETDDGQFRPAVRYRYDFDGTEYESDRLREGQDPPTGPRSLAEDIVADYEVGQTVTATLLSGTPDQAALEPASDSWPYVVAGTTTLLGSVFAILGAGISVSGLVG